MPDRRGVRGATRSAAPRVIVSAALATVVAAPAFAIELVPDWQRTVTRGTQSLYGAGIAVDSSDNIYVCGSLPGTTLITARFDQLGNPIWQREFDNPGTREVASWVTTDRLGNVIVTGYTVSGSNLVGTGWVTLKYDPDGTLLWSDVLAVPRGFTVRAVVDPAGNIYVAGRAWVSNPQLNTTDDMMTVKYLPDGTRDWIRYAGFDPTSADAASSLALTPDGNVVVTGGADDVLLSWPPAGGASAYNVWTVAAKTDIDRARAASAPPALGVTGCSPPASAVGNACPDVGGVSRPPSAVFYQVRAVCSGQAEGP